jgi:hypothetical protein
VVDAIPSQQPEREAAPLAGWHLAPGHLLVVGFWGGLFYLLNWAAIQEPDLWGHAAWGRWILEHGTLPSTDPFGTLSGLPAIDSAWLSQVLLGAVATWGGAEALSLLFAITVLAACLLLARAFYLQSRSLLVAHCGVLLVAAVGWNRTATARPEMFGTLCLAVLLWLLVRDRMTDAHGTSCGASRRRLRLELWLGLPALLAVWANLHSSFVCGLLVVGCWTAGTVWDTARRERSLRAVLASPDVRRWISLAELALGATCLNPYGVRLLLYLCWFADYEQLSDLADWQRLVMLGAGGREVVLSLLGLLLLFRLSRQRLPAADLLLVAACSLAAARGLRLVWCYAAVFGVVATPHLAELGTRVARLLRRGVAAGDGSVSRRLRDLATARTWSCSVVALVLLWIAFALSPASTFVGSREPRAPERLYGDAVPWQLSQFLREQPPQGQIFHPHWWGDWLTWDGPPGLHVFLTTNLHLTSRSVWIDYRIVRETRAGWNNVLDRYGVQTVILDKRRQRTLLGYLRSSPEWRREYEDATGIVLGRVPPAEKSAAGPTRMTATEEDGQKN